MLTEYEERQMENYFDPALAYERYCDAQDRAYEEMIEDAYCWQCENCRLPDKGFYQDSMVAFCDGWLDDFIYTTETPKDNDCPKFYPR